MVHPFVSYPLTGAAVGAIAGYGYGYHNKHSGKNEYNDYINSTDYLFPTMAVTTSAALAMAGYKRFNPSTVSIKTANGSINVNPTTAKIFQDLSS